jgi:hypothetical protein
MQEPTTEPDWEAIEAAVSGPSEDDPRSNEKEAFMRGVLTLAMQTVLMPRGKSTIRCADHARARILVALYLLRIPGHERILSLSHIADITGFDVRSVSRFSVDMKAKLGLPDKITRTHTKRTPAALK